MKKYTALLLCVIMLIALSACGGDKEVSTSTPETTPETADVSAVADKSIMPDVVGKTKDEAIAAITAQKLAPVAADCHSEKAAGTVVSQSIKSGETLENGTSVIIQVSNGMSSADSALVEMKDPFVEMREKLDVGANRDYQPVNSDNMKAMWLSQLDLIPVFYDEENACQTNCEKFTACIDKIMENLSSSGFNTVIVQVHPDCDTMFPSEYYPWSDYLLGGYGNVSSYDAMQIMLDSAHAHGLSFHAWINPMRGMSEEQISDVNIAYQIRKWYDDEEAKSLYLFKSGEKLYLNPAYEEVRKYIVAVASEIVRYYDVDAVHMDDYFYPSGDASFDRMAYLEQGEFNSLIDFRKNNINLLVSQMYKAVKAENPKVLYGISPAGDIERNMNTLGADVERWCSEAGYVDYIVPQIYFGFLHSTLPFNALSDKWEQMCTEPSVKLHLGITLHKVNERDQYAGANDGAQTEWIDSDDITKRSFEYLGQLQRATGFALFSYQYVFDAVTGSRNERTAPECDNFLPAMQALYKK